MSTSNSKSEIIFENNSYQVDTQGNVYEKNGSDSGNPVASVNPDKDVADQIKKFEQQFEELVARKNELVSSSPEESHSAKLKEKIEELEEKIENTQALGDTDQIVDELEKIKSDTKTEDAAEPEEAEQPQREKVKEQDEVHTADESEAKADADLDAENEPEPDSSDKVSKQDKTELDYYVALVDKAKELIKQNDWPYVKAEFDILESKWGEGPEVGEELEEQRRDLLGQLHEHRKAFEERKQQHYEKQKRLRAKNLEKKQELLEQIRDIVEKKQWKKKKKAHSIASKWNAITYIPKEHEEKLNKEFEALFNEFKEHKVEHLVQQKEKEEENLIGKLAVVDKLESLVISITAEDNDWKELEAELKNLKRQWRKIGRVPVDKNQEVWGRYKSALDAYNNRKFKYNLAFRKRVEKSLKKKIALCEEAEALTDVEDIAKGAQTINRLHRRWKKAGNLPQKEENELWDRFKAATDAFNERKSKNIDLLREQEEEHYRQKLELIEEAEDVKDTTNWQSGADKMQHLMKQWKKIGPVPRSKNKKIWKQFKGAMDHFYDRRRDHFKSVKKEQKENLKKKKELIEKLLKLGEHEDPIAAVDEAKTLQEEFKQIGYVPIKQKNIIWKEYREACDVIYDRFRAAKSNKATTKVLKAKGYESDEIDIIQKNKKEISKLRKKADALNEEIIQYKEAQTYFKPSGKGNDLRDELQQKIDKAEKKMAQLEAKMEKYQQELDRIED